MKTEEYRAKLTALEHGNLSWPEYKQAIAKLQAEYLAEQAVPDAKSALRVIIEAHHAGNLPDLGRGSLIGLSTRNCELLELLDDGSPDERNWRYRHDNFVIDVHAETGEVNLMSVCLGGDRPPNKKPSDGMRGAFARWVISNW